MKLDPKKPLTAAAICLLVLASACSSNGGDADGGNGNGAPQTKSSQWTTLGTRATPAEDGRIVTSNEGGQWTTYDPPATYPGTVQLPTQFISMRDGKQLAVYVTLPADADGNAVTTPLPTILVQTSYNGVAGQTVSAIGGADPYLVQRGYANVVVDVRGTGQSQGSWEAFGADEQADYAETVDWVAKQPFCNGSIGLFGVSYLGITTVLTAAQQHPSVKAAFPIVPIGDGYRDIVFTGGQVNPTFIPIWLGLVSVLGLTNPTALTDPTVGIPALLEHVISAVTNFQVPTILRALLGEPETAYDSAFWSTRSPLETTAQIQVPTFVVGGLHDIFQRSEPMTYERLKTRVPAKLLIGPWTHIQAAGGNGLPVDGVPPMNQIVLRWFDQYVKGLDVGADTLPNVTQYVLGYGHYVTASDWPHPDASARRLYLRGDKSLDTAAPAAGEASNTVAQLPIQGLCSISTSQWTAGLLGLIPLPCFENSNSAERWAIKYETPVMTEDYYINGPIQADIWMSTTALDAGLSVRVDDVDENGVAKSLTNGLQTASLRAVDDSRSRKLDGQMIQPWHPYTQAAVQEVGSGNIVLVPVEIFPTSAMITKGHRLRVAVGASNLPQGVPPVPTLLQSLAGVLTIYSDAEHPSSVVLPAVPASALN
ncbi:MULTISPECIES: CocE/NonD family hydrolase [Hydrocarboniphaga]|uniref:Peptidase S15 n=1 Tax=Hydrocarboniphaga effusa AP103 TaxID=1172194 RepID=I8TBW5_9GAMM|nr:MULTISPECIES: CocE/NonD family hydrolase [Hydrocarboniphaga]EIT71078.1 peptidase S15 [Hydrocarboniphaga effusa AP103]MDZ4079561.1 CocE/NonD family hydrolase [Hydrocarboniphaga sp.]